VIAIQPGRVEHDGESIYFEVSGAGDAVVFSHGLGGNHASSSRSGRSPSGTA
jgi:hypothetical protein